MWTFLEKLRERCIQLDIRELSFQRALFEGGHDFVEFLANSVHLTLADPFQAQRLREGRRVRSIWRWVSVIGIRETGDREVLGFELGMSEDISFWLEFCGVQLAINDAHEGCCLSSVFLGI